MELMLSLRRMNGQYAKSKQQLPNHVSIFFPTGIVIKDYTGYRN